MSRFSKPQIKPAASTDQQKNAAGNVAAMAEKLGLNPIRAVWPTGISQLAQAIGVCQRCDADEVCSDWLARAPEIIKLPPDFCPNAPTLTRAKSVTKSVK